MSVQLSSGATGLQFGMSSVYVPDLIIWAALRKEVQAFLSIYCSHMWQVSKSCELA